MPERPGLTVFDFGGAFTVFITALTPWPVSFTSSIDDEFEGFRSTAKYGVNNMTNNNQFHSGRSSIGPRLPLSRTANG